MYVDIAFSHSPLPVFILSEIQSRDEPTDIVIDEHIYIKTIKLTR